MATNTYVALDKKTVTSAVGSVTFTSIPSTYTDLVIVIQASTSGGVAMYYQLNGDTTASNYSSTGMYGDGTTAGSYRTSNNTISGVGTQPNVAILNFQNYSNTTTFKTLLSRGNDIGNDTRALVSLWRNTAAINQIVIGASGNNFNVGSTFSLYGIKADTNSTLKATGGVISSDANYWYHTFAMSGTFTPLQSLSCDYLVIAGGGGGGFDEGGGGGAGGFRSFNSQSFSATNYTITVGAGGAGRTTSTGSGNPGSNSSISGTGISTSATGGGSGASGYGAAPSAGGSGGGYRGTAVAGNAGGYTPVEGYAGGINSRGAGGGGGAGAVGASGTGADSRGMSGGIGATSSLTNAIGAATNTGVLSSGNYYYAGGGGAGAVGIFSLGGGYGGTGGGGMGGGSDNTVPSSGIAATGGGGGGASGWGGTSTGGNGGSGVVIVRYAK